MLIKNLTPHVLNIHLSQDKILTISPDGLVARVAQERNERAAVFGIPVTESRFGEVENLPEPRAGHIYIVSGLVLAAVPERADVFAPGEAVRDEAGRIIGCTGLSCTPAYAGLPDPKDPVVVAEDDDGEFFDPGDPDEIKIHLPGERFSPPPAVDVQPKAALMSRGLSEVAAHRLTSGNFGGIMTQFAIEICQLPAGEHDEFMYEHRYTVHQYNDAGLVESREKLIRLVISRNGVVRSLPLSVGTYTKPEDRVWLESRPAALRIRSEHWHVYRRPSDYGLGSPWSRNADV